MFNEVASAAGKAFDKKLSGDEREKSTKIRVMTTDEADAFISENSYDHIGVVHNLSDHSIYAMQEFDPSVVVRVPVRHSALGIDSFFDPGSYDASQGLFKHFKVGAGSEINFIRTPTFVRYPRFGFRLVVIKDGKCYITLVGHMGAIKFPVVFLIQS